MNFFRKKEKKDTISESQNHFNRTVNFRTSTFTSYESGTNRSVEVLRSSRPSLPSLGNFTPPSSFQNPRSIDAVPGNDIRISSITYPQRTRPPLTSTTFTPIQSQPSTNTSTIPTYSFPYKNIGKVLIFNNRKFEKADRLGSEKDTQNLQQLFKSYKYVVKVKEDLTKDRVISTLENFTSDSGLKTCNMSIVVFMSHGRTTNHVTEIATKNGEYLNVEEVLDIFARCDYLKDKPKIFIFQCCRGKKEIHVDATRINPVLTDSLIAYSTLPGYVSYRNPKDGSWYIQSICKVFREKGREMDIENMLKIVNTEMSTIDPTCKQITSFENRGFKTCYLTPRT